MSCDDSQQQDCTVYIEQLKSDNASLKLNAASKISVIAGVLGHNRIRDQLIPYLVQIIEQMDNDNDFLIKISEGLLELKSFCNNDKQISILIHPLKILACLDQPSVRDHAITCLKKLPEQTSPGFLQNYYFPLIKQLSSKNGAYSQRVVVACLIPVAYPNVTQKSQEQLRKIFKQLALQQNSPLVRRALAENIQNLRPVLSKNLIWQAFITDPIDIIRIKALETAHNVISGFKESQTNDNFLKFVKQVDPNRRSWRIRYSLAECLAKIMDKLDKETIKKDVLQTYEELLKDPQPEVRAIALISTPALTAKLSKAQSYNTLFQYFEKASKDGNKQTAPTVKLALVQAIVPYFKTIDIEKITQNGIPILSSLLKDENLLVRIGIVNNIGDLHSILGKQLTMKHIIPLLESVLSDKKWRFKLAVAENIQKLFKTLGYEDFKQFFDKIMNLFMKDHNHSVRQQTIKCLVSLSSTFKPEIELQIIAKYINQLTSQINYIYRCSGLMLLERAALGSAIGKKETNELFMAITQKMSEKNQKIPNVLIYYFDVYAKIKNSLNSQSRKQFANYSRKVLQTITDQDVLLFLQRAEQ